MFLTESEYLLHENVAGKSSIQAVDDHIRELAGSPTAVLTAQLIANRHDVPVADVSRVLDALVKENALTSRRMVRCPVEQCAGLTPAESVERARADGDEAICDGPCQKDLTAMDGLVEVWSYRIRPRTDVSG